MWFQSAHRCAKWAWPGQVPTQSLSPSHLWVKPVTKTTPSTTSPTCSWCPPSALSLAARQVNKLPQEITHTSSFCLLQSEPPPPSRSLGKSPYHTGAWVRIPLGNFLQIFHPPPLFPARRRNPPHG